MIELYHGDCLEYMKGMGDNSVDAIVTDPPYGLSFMGKDWDHGVPGIPYWAESLRVAKPGAFLLAFGGRRTEHRLTCAIEDAGWQIVDKIAWVYATGFPKSYNVSKNLTALIPSSLRCVCAHHLNHTGLSSRDGYQNEHDSRDGLLHETLDTCRSSAPLLDDALGHNRDGQRVDAHGTEQEHTPDRSGIVHLSIGDCVRLLEHLSTGCQAGDSRQCDMLVNMLRAGLKVSRKMALRTLGTEDLACDAVLALPYFDSPNSSISRIYHKCAHCQKYLAVAGYGTALKPAIEEICVARKPVEGGYVANMLTWGVAGLNIDGCRVGTTDKLQTLEGSFSFSGTGGANETGKKIVKRAAGAGRWPANLIHDGSDEVVGLFPETKSGKAIRHNSGGNTFGGNRAKPPMEDVGYPDSGSAARFFKCCPQDKTDLAKRLIYVAKASRSERTCGGKVECNHPTVKPLELMRYLVRLVKMPTNTVVLDPFMGSGTTGMACKLESCDFIGCEIDDEYFAIAKKRIEEAEMQPRLL